MTPYRRNLLAAPARVSAVYAILFSIACLSIVYLPRWFVQVGLTTAEVGSILAVAAIVKVPMTLLAGTAADVLAGRKRVLLWVSLLLMLGIPVLFVVRDWLWLCVAWAVLGGLISTCIPLTDSIAVNTVQRESVSYGRMRMWGSLFFLVTSLVTGWLISGRGEQALVVLFLLGGVALCAAVAAMPDYQASQSDNAQSPDLGKDTGRVDQQVGKTFFEVIKLPGFVGFLTCAAILMASHAALYSLSTVYWSEAGISLPAIGVLWATGVVAEVLFFFLSASLLKRWGPWQLLLIAGLTGTVRWLITATVTDFSVLMFSQSLHAVTFTFTQLAVVTYIGSHVPEKLTSSAQSLYDSCALGVIFGIALFASGRLSEVNIAWSFYGMAAMSAFGSGIAAILLLRNYKRKLPA